MLIKERNSFHNNDFSLVIIESNEKFCCDEINCFDCGDCDLNEFFQIDAIEYKKQLLAETYYFQPKKATDEKLFHPVAFVSFLNDSIPITPEEKKTGKKNFVKHLKKSIPYPKRNHQSFPAVKIGRLGVSTSYQGKKIGTYLLNMVKEFFVTGNRTGCRFLTVDSYVDSVKFYQNNGFDFLWDGDQEKSTRIMFFDLIGHRIDR